MGNIYDELKDDELLNGLKQVLAEYDVLKHQVRRIKRLIIRIENSGLHNTAELLREALAGDLNG
jgi:hypothetical protein